MTRVSRVTINALRHRSSDRRVCRLPPKRKNYAPVDFFMTSYVLDEVSLKTLCSFLIPADKNNKGR